jgi:hypothetical protein
VQRKTGEEYLQHHLRGECQSMPGGVLNVAMVQSNLELQAAIVDLNNSTTKQQQTTNRLTRRIFWLTWTLVFFGVMQIALIAVQVGPTLWGWLFR